MSKAGLFAGKRVELIEGMVVEMAAMSRPHWAASNLAGDALRRIFTEGYVVTTNLPAYLGEFSDPEPDIAIIPGSPRDYLEDTPTRPLLVVEVSDTSLRYDQTWKAGLYAMNAVPDYWIVNLVDRRLEVRRGPSEDAGQPFGFGYRSLTVLTPADLVSPLANPDASIRVGDLLP
jgi:Uma2 family endonuclease